MCNAYIIRAMNAMTMEAVRTSETSVYFSEIIRRYIPESCHLHTRRRENLKSHIVFMCPGKFENLHVLFLQLAKPRQETVTAVFTIVFWILLRLEVSSTLIILTDYF
jgi:hypothetical protein